MSLSSKISLILIAVIGLFAIANDQIQQRIFFKRFQDVEQRKALQDVQRVVNALEQEVEELDQLNLRWSYWDDTYAYVQRRDEGFERSNLSEIALKNQGLDLLFICDEEGNVVWSRITDPDLEGGVVQLRGFPRSRLLPGSHPLLTDDDQRKFGEGSDTRSNREHNHRSGILLTEHKPLLVSSRPILDSRQEGPSRGTLITGRFLGDELDSTLTGQTEVDFQIWQIDGRHELEPAVALVLDRVTGSTDAVIDDTSAEILHVYKTFNDFRERPEILLRANIQRDIFATGKSAVAFGLVSTIAGGFVLLLVLMTLLKRIVIDPISALTRHTVEIGRKEDFRAKLDLDRRDEVGTLSREFDNMMEKLEHAREALVDTARTAGMSEIATGILHNVGNVLNSVNISASMVAQRVQEMSVTDLVKVSTVLEEKGDRLAEFISTDPKGKHLQPLLAALTSQLGEERASILNEVGSLSEGIEHICELIKSQQSFAVQSELVEPMSLADKVDEALSITDKALTKDSGLRIERRYDDLPIVMVEKHKVLEILVNLIQNARQAMDEAETVDKCLRLSVSAADDVLRVEVKDNGPGIEPANLVKVFNLGFTTKSSGHGYGLHTAANAATEMGGSLEVHSDGPGEGAAFVLELPMRIAETVGDAR